MDERATYVNIMITSLKTKAELLDALTVQTRKQERLLGEEKPDTNSLDDTMTEKERLLQRLNEEDDGFEALYAKLSGELKTNKEKYKNEILEMQELIGAITDKSVALTALEQRNRLSMDRYIARKKKEIKDYQTSSRTVTSYYKSMSDRHQGQSCFLDQKK